MQFTAAEITAFLGSFLWPFFRIGALLMVAPLTGSQNVPVRVRLGLAFFITLLVVPVLPPVPVVDPLSLPSVSIILQQVLIGAAMGLAVQLVFSAVIAGAQIIAMQMGLGFASMIDPVNGQDVPVLAQFYLMFVTLVFLALNGHLVMIRLLVESFQSLPIGQGLDADAYYLLAGWGTRLFADAVWLALPAVASLLVVNVAFGVMSRAAPQLNIFSVGFSVTLVVGFVVLLFTLEAVVPQFTTMTNEMFALVRQVISPEVR
jgi:flagellar biosynthetic protein FliR